MIRVALAAAVFFAAAAMAQTVPEPEGYRVDNYRAPVPDSVVGGVTIDTDAAFDLWEDGVPFIDVFPHAPKPQNLPKGTIWREKPHVSIERAVWLPNVGYGQLADVTADYFRAGLDAATASNKGAPVVIFCRADCWMSWNAAKRAIAWGYISVYWFPEGTDGWNEWSYPTERLKPEEFP